MRYFLFLFLFPICFSFCAGGNIKVKLKSDLSGELHIYQKQVSRKDGGVFLGSGLQAISESELTLKERFYKFQNITEILPPGMRFLIFKEEVEDHQTLLCVVDTSVNSPLLSALGIRRENIELLANEAKSRDDLFRFNNLSGHMQFELFLPFSIKTVSFLESRNPADWTARNDGSGKIVINLPLSSFWNNEYQQTVVIITYKD